MNTNSHARRNLILAALLLSLAIAYTFAVRFIDVAPIGPEGSSVGFSSLNRFIFELLGVDLFFYTLTDRLGVAAILVAASFAVLGLCQWIGRRSLFRVDPSLLLLGGHYLLTIALYVLFEKVVINVRPILMDGHLEASFPSSHTMITLSILGSAMRMFREWFGERRRLLFVLDGLCLSVISVTVIGRLLSGVDWFSDIVGGILYSAALLSLFCASLSLAKRRRNAGKRA